MISTRLFSALLGSALICTLTACEDDKPKIDPKGPQPPPSGPGYDTTMSDPADSEFVELELVTERPRPFFDTWELPGLAAGDWIPTEGGSWFATVTPGEGAGVESADETVSVRLSLWTADGTPVLLTDDADDVLVLPLGPDMFDGWNESISGMKVGEVRKLAIPHDQTIGQDGRGLLESAGRGENAQLLVADVTLLAIDAEEPSMLQISAADS